MRITVANYGDVGSGVGEAQLTQRLRRSFAELGWRKRNVEIKKAVDGVKRGSISHDIHHFQAIVEARMARSESFSHFWAAMFFSDKCGMATAQWPKLMDRVARSAGNPCPLVLIGLPATVIDPAS